MYGKLGGCFLKGWLVGVSTRAWQSVCGPMHVIHVISGSTPSNENRKCLSLCEDVKCSLNYESLLIIIITRPMSDLNTWPFHETD